VASAPRTEPVLRQLRGDGSPTGAVLVLHGGRANSLEPVRRTNLAALRMRPFATAVAHRAGSARIGVFLLRNRVRGWNEQAADPMADTAWALERIRLQHGPIPVVLIGHSMGGRAALRSAGNPQVVAIVALAPWIPTDEPFAQLQGRAVLIIHGDRDKVTDPRSSRDYAAVAESKGIDVKYRSIVGGDHAMLHSARAWHALAAEFAVAQLTGSRDDDHEAFVA
jgi:alpha-beta hydrolase superfamily lysophospholipase